jgi:hypothetical protein
MEGRAAQPSASDAETQAYNRKWMDWVESLVKSETLLSGGPLLPTATEVGKDTAVDLPLQPTDIYGYLLIEAGSMEEVIDIVRQAPHTELGGKTIVRPCLDVPMS